MAKTTRLKAASFEGVIEPFAHLNKELKALGMKKPGDTLSEGKVKFINRILFDIREFLESEPEGRYLDMLDDEILPQYSDAILILSQYEGALKAFRERYFGWDGVRHGWFLAD